MKNGSKKWGFEDSKPSSSTDKIRASVTALNANLNKEDKRPLIPLAHADSSPFSSYRTTSVADHAVIDSLVSAQFNCYSAASGILPARRAIADYLNRDLPYKLSPDDVFVTLGCKQAIEVSLTALSGPNANVLLPRPGYPYFEAIAQNNNIEIRYFDLLPDRAWEIDLQAVETLSDENTVAIVIINPGNPCGNVYSHQHLKNIAETAKKIGTLVIADEAYAYLTFGSNPFVPMGIFGSIVPVLTLGSLSKRWNVAGWRLGWLAITDPNGILKKFGVVDSIISFINIAPDPPTFIQAAIPQILENTEKDFFSRIVNLMKQCADLSYERINEISCLTCPRKPEGSKFLLTKLDLSQLEDIEDDFDFCLKLAKEESVIVLPGNAIGSKNWLRITFAIEPSTLEVGLQRVKAFCERHSKNQI